MLVGALDAEYGNAFYFEVKEMYPYSKMLDIQASCCLMFLVKMYLVSCYIGHNSFAVLETVLGKKKERKGTFLTWQVVHIINML